MRQLAHLIVCVVGVGAATAIGMTRVVGAQGPPPANLVPCGVPQGAPAGGPPPAIRIQHGRHPLTGSQLRSRPFRGDQIIAAPGDCVHLTPQQTLGSRVFTHVDLTVF